MSPPSYSVSFSSSCFGARSIFYCRLAYTARYMLAREVYPPHYTFGFVALPVLIRQGRNQLNVNKCL